MYHARLSCGFRLLVDLHHTIQCNVRWTVVPAVQGAERSERLQRPSPHETRPKTRPPFRRLQRAKGEMKALAGTVEWVECYTMAVVEMVGLFCRTLGTIPNTAQHSSVAWMVSFERVCARFITTGKSVNSVIERKNGICCDKSSFNRCQIRRGTGAYSL